MWQLLEDVAVREEAEGEGGWAVSFWKAFMSVYHDYPWLVFGLLACSLVINTIFMLVENGRTECKRETGDKDK